MVQCCAVNCTQEGRIRFPRNPTIRRRWEFSVSRKNFKATDNSRLCGSHFQPEDFQVQRFYDGGSFQRRRLKKGVVPSVFSWKCKPSPPRPPRLRDRLKKRVECVRTLFDEEPLDNVGPVEDGAGCADDLPEVEYVCDILPDFQCVEEVCSPEDCSKVDVSSDECSVDAKPEQPETSGHKVTFSACSFKADDKGIHFYTGLETYDKFMFVFSTLWPEAAAVNYRENISIVPEDAFLLSLMKLRRNTALYELSRFFGITERQVSNVFFTWAHFMFDMWSMLDVWPSRELVDVFMPEGFKAAYPTTRVLVDCTEMSIEKPNNPGAQQASFSQYKNRNTVKVEVGASPAGLLCHLSDAYGGSASDRQIVERSGLIEKCEKNDSVMADRGFNVQDLFAHKDVTVNIPSFVKDGQLPGLTVLKDRALSAKRVHIERLIGLMKTYKLLSQTLKSCYVPIARKLVGICCTLCNFREGIVDEQA